MTAHVQCILLIGPKKRKGRRSRRCPRATNYVLLSKAFTEMRPEIKNFFRKNNIVVITDSSDPRTLLANSQQPYKLDIFEFKLANVDVSRKITDPTIYVKEDRDFISHNKEEALIFFPKSGNNIRSSEFLELDWGTTFYHAIDDRSLRFIEACLSYGVEFGYGHHGGGTPIHFAVKMNSPTLLKMFLKNGYDANKPATRMLDLILPLHRAAKEGQFEIVRILVENGANVNALDTYSEEDPYVATPLLYASANEHTEVAKFLVENGADVNAEYHVLCKFEPRSRAHHDNTPLEIAASDGHVAVVEALLKASAEIDKKCVAPGNFNCATPLMYAARYGELELVNCLIERGANVNGIQNMNPHNYNRVCDDEPEGFTPLHSATFGGHSEVVKFLTSQGADVNARGSYNERPVLIAAEKGDIGMVKLLLEAGADINAEALDPDYESNILLIPFRKENREFLDFVLSRRSELSDACILRAFYFALRTGSNFCRDHLNTVCPPNFAFNDENLQNVDSVALLFGAIHKNRQDLVEQLLSRGVDVNGVHCHCRDSKSEEHSNLCGGALHIAAAFNLEGNIVKLLIEHGADVNLPNDDGMTPFYYAALHNNQNAVNILIEKKANIRGDPDLISVAVASSSAEILETLLRKGADPIIMIDTTSAPRDPDNGSPELETEYEKMSVALVSVCRTNCDLKKLKLCLKYGEPHLVKNLRNDDKTEITYLLCVSIRYKHISAWQTLLDYAFNYDLPLLTMFSSSFDSENLEGSLDFFKSLVCHIVKMTSARKLFQRKDVYNLQRLESSAPDDYALQCKAEVQKMQNMKVGDTDVSFFDVLVQDVCHISNYFRNISIEREFQTAAYKDEFPIYASILEWQFEKGAHRRYLLNRCTNIFAALFEHFSGLPIDVKEMIVDLLDNQNLQMLLAL